MAKIPMGDFGNALPEVQRTQLPQSNIPDLANVLGNAGQVATSYANNKTMNNASKKWPIKLRS